MKQKKYKIFSILILFSLNLIGCSIVKEKDPKNLEETINLIEEKEIKLEENVKDIQLNKKENELFQNKLNENLENKIFSNDIEGEYIIINNDNTKLLKLHLNDVEENITTEGNYGSLWVYKNINQDNYGLFYSFVEENDIEYLIKEVPQIFTQTPIVETKMEPLDISIPNEKIKKIYDINCIDEAKFCYYGYGFLYELDENNKVLAIIINRNLEQFADINDIIDNCFNIEIY